jgi:acylphosphatase
MRVSRRFVVTGRVQGVGFRFFVYEAARAEGLSGWVANRADGRVEIALEGDGESVDRVDRHIRRGPAGARVDHVEAFDDAPSDRYTGFEIRHAT